MSEANKGQIKKKRKLSYRDYKEDKICDLCERTVEILTRHHLMPKSIKRKHKPILVCLSCRDTIHIISNKNLADHYNTLETLKGAPELRTYMKWIKKQNIITIKKKKRRN